MIPKIIHQIWIQGESNIPDKLKLDYHHCQQINHEFQYCFWDDTLIQKLLVKYFDQEYLDLYLAYSKYAQKTDFARYIILYLFGGIYLDMDTICKKDLSVFLNCKFFLTVRNDFLNQFYRRYQTGIIGSVPKHPLFPIIFNNLLARKNARQNITYSTGTRLFYDSIREYQKQNKDDITIIDPIYLHPCGILDPKSCPNNCQECYIVHTNYSSWSFTSYLVQIIIKNWFWIVLVMIIVIVLFYWKSIYNI